MLDKHILEELADIVKVEWGALKSLLLFASYENYHFKFLIKTSADES